MILVERADAENAAAIASGATHKDETPLTYGEFRDLLDKALNEDPASMTPIDREQERILHLIGLRE